MFFFRSILAFIFLLYATPGPSTAEWVDLASDNRESVRDAIIREIRVVVARVDQICAMRLTIDQQGAR